MRLRRSSFTLLEMMVVIAILGALMGVMVVNLTDAGEEANVEATKATIAQVEGAIKMHKLSKKKYPSTDEGLEMLLDSGRLDVLPTDAWGNPIYYQYPGSADKPFDLWSLGADGQDGGEGFNRDIFNRVEE